MVSEAYRFLEDMLFFYQQFTIIFYAPISFIVEDHTGLHLFMDMFF